MDIIISFTPPAGKCCWVKNYSFDRIIVPNVPTVRLKSPTIIVAVKYDINVS